MGNIYQEILDQVTENHPAAVETVLSGPEGSISDGLKRRITEAKPKTDDKGRRAASVSFIETPTEFVISEPILPPERLIILGGGHIALPLCDMGSRCGFSVCVVDDRPEFANYQRFPTAATVICDAFEKAIHELNITAFDYIVIVTRGHKSDADCLRTILPGTQSAYLGMIGSRRRVHGLLDMLLEEGFDPERLGQICTPIGLKIGAVTPDEIAVSIMAEVISYRRLSQYGSPERFCNDSDIELPVIRYLSENDDPKAIVTVVETKGSTPRGAGAKMAVSPLGKTTGSIGGGCSEAAVIRDAVKIIGTGRYRLIDIDMTGDVAETDGMVCGGIMRVLLEDGSTFRSVTPQSEQDGL